jgi:BirA family biotin operon repressor/biotin-[acetyl-CoA-carboxylase] ligase
MSSNEKNPLDDIRLGFVTKQWAQNNSLYVHHDAVVASTNDLAKAKAFDESLLENSLCLFLADHQTAGRGRGKNHWLDAKPGSTLLSSWSFLLNAKPQPTTSCLVGLAVFRALSTTWSFLPWSLKAPNDIYLGDKKVAGILLETVSQGDEVRLIIGLGINVFASPDQVDTAGSILEFLPRGVPLLGEDWMAFMDRLLFEMTVALSQCEEPLSASVQATLVGVLNLFPLLDSPYTRIESNGTLHTADGKTLPWWEL